MNGFLLFWLLCAVIVVVVRVLYYRAVKANFADALNVKLFSKETAWLVLFAPLVVCFAVLSLIFNGIVSLWQRRKED